MKLPQLLLLLPVTTLGQSVYFNCTASPNPESVTVEPSVTHFKLQLSNGGPNGFCHALIRLAADSKSHYLYVRLNSSLASSFSVLSLSSDFGPSGVPIATVTASNQTVYRAFASTSSSLYARLSSSGGVSDGILLDVAVVTECPVNWFPHNGACYGAPSVDSAVATFRDAATGCRHVRANLAMGFDSASVVNSAISATGGSWPTDQSVWIGAAVSGSKVYYLDGSPFVIQRSKHIVQQDSSGACVKFQDGAFYRRDCSQRQPYLCSRESGVADGNFYTLDGLGQLLGEAAATDSPTRVPSSYLWFIGVGVGCVCLVVTVMLRMRIVCDRTCSCGSWRWCVNGADDGYGVSVAMEAPPAPSSVPPAPSSEAPPTYEEAANFGAPRLGGGDAVAKAAEGDEAETPPTYAEATAAGLGPRPAS